MSNLDLDRFLQDITTLSCNCRAPEFIDQNHKQIGWQSKECEKKETISYSPKGTKIIRKQIFLWKSQGNVIYCALKGTMVKRDSNVLHSKYVLPRIDKAAGNVAFIHQQSCVLALVKELWLLLNNNNSTDQA